MKKTINFILCVMMVALGQQTKAASGWAETENSFEVWATSEHSNGPETNWDNLAHEFYLTTPCLLSINQYLNYNPNFEVCFAGSEIRIPIAEDTGIFYWWNVAAYADSIIDDPEHFEYDLSIGYLHTFTTVNAIPGDIYMDAYVTDEASAHSIITW